MKKANAILFFFFIAFHITVDAESQSGSVTDIKLPFIELPYNLSYNYSFPGMNQSLFITADISKISHQLLYDSFSGDSRCLRLITTFIWDYMLFVLPGGPGWLHEEWHRAVMGQYGIHSYNDVYKFDIFSETIAVSHIRDEDLAFLKERHNSDMVRLSEAGNEAEIELVREYRRDSFFNGRQIRYEHFQMWFVLINASYYVNMCRTGDANRITDQMNDEDGSNIKKRDFTGLDFTAWIYDLSRPGELYSARGVHPSGIGIDRYIKYSDLTESEKKYLKKTGLFTLFNFASPQLFGFERFNIPDNSITGSSQFNFMVIHHLTSFGNDIILSLMFKKKELNLETSLHCYNNEKNYFPGMEIALRRFPLSLFNTKFYTDCKMMLFSQPEDQRFRESSGETGGLIGAGISVPIAGDKVELFIDGDVKSRGWIEGNPYLGKSIQSRSGITVYL